MKQKTKEEKDLYGWIEQIIFTIWLIITSIAFLYLLGQEIKNTNNIVRTSMVIYSIITMTIPWYLLVKSPRIQ